MGQPRLRAVGPDDAVRGPLSVSEASAQGDRLEELLAMRRVIAAALDSPKTLARDLASLSRRLLEIGKEVDALVAERKEAAGEFITSEDEEWTAI